MKHRFYSKTQKQQNQIKLLIAFGALLIILSFFFISWVTKFYLIGIIVFFLVLSLIAPFFDTPSLKKNKKILYHSLLFISEAPKDGVIKIHGGTLFDYFFVIDKKMSGRQRKNFIIQQYLEGLLDLIQQNEHHTNNLKIRGTSYMINDRTAGRIGFEVIETDIIQKLILIVNYFNIASSYSIANDKLSFPKIANTKTFEANLHDLLEQKDYIEKLNKKLRKNYLSPAEP